ncbi:DUF4378 domain-containing protein/VARLMGL domain-containing protein [Cephalotus follicularis]|uniref:DUF4378 domain-containing protein/VARLMGL domain-containing protein n=1 Tax=Cephalotus follicularis TaxID=3775 RepID=A0A1Q3CNU5_CEPFO|nr:DUF4378 domain-containing protein/VARLMGL domain-containing protein [Cephalotus follicularis]
MAAKLLHTLADDNPDLQRQIGCMTGIFQLFDRQHMVTPRRLTHKRLPPGTTHFNDNGLERESNIFSHRQTAAETSLSKSASERQRISTESSRASFSSTCSSSLSSLDCNKTGQPETLSFDRSIYPETPSRDPMMNHASTSPHFGQQSLDLRDVVKDSMYREARGLPVKSTANEEAMGHPVKQRDSPRSLQLSKSVDGPYGVGINEKQQNVPADLKESIRVLAKLREAPWYCNEAREAKDGSWHSVSKDAPRFSLDGRELNCLSFESRDSMKSTQKVNEQPRLSLDSRERAMWGTISDLKANYLSKNFQISGNSNDKIHELPQSSGTQKRPPSVVAKLMGLEALPDSTLASGSQVGLIKTSQVRIDPFLRSSKPNDLHRSIRIPHSQRNSLKDPASPRWKNPDLVMKPISSSKFPIEPAPWRQPDGTRSSQKPAIKPVKVPAKTPDSFPSVYSEIEKKLKNLEFKQSGRDLRALKQILEAMQDKGLLETQKEEQASNFGTQRDYEPKCPSPKHKPRLLTQRNQQSNHVAASTTRGSDYSRTFESPIVIMKPAKLVEQSGIPASSVIRIDGLLADTKKGPTNNRTAKDQFNRISRSDYFTTKKNSGRNIRTTEILTKPRQVTKESTTSSLKSSGSVSPRLQQKKVELEKQSRPPTPPSDSNKPRRQSNRQPIEAGSPGGRRRLKSYSQHCDDQLSQISNESRTSSHQGDEVSSLPDRNTMSSRIDVEVTCSERSIEKNDSQSPSMKTVKYSVSGSMQKKSAPRLDEVGSFAELATAVPEHPSPVSVLDASLYSGDALSPVKHTPNALTDDDAQDSNDSCNDDKWKTANNLLLNSLGSSLASEINRKKLQNIEHLVQKLRRLNSSHDEASTDYIASLCENTNPDDRYISEILLASGLLLRDLASGLTTFQLHPSGHPINPELFFVLEQTKASTSVSKEEYIPSKISHSKPDYEKSHRKLIFDTVNEILIKKLSLMGVSPEPWVKSNRLAKKTFSAQKLLKELCLEIEKLKTNKPHCSEEEEDDGVRSILWDDVMRRSESWTGFHSEISGVVLDVERSLFKDLVDEIVRGEEASLRVKPGRRRQLFAK